MRKRLYWTLAVCCYFYLAVVTVRYFQGRVIGHIELVIARWIVIATLTGLAAFVANRFAGPIVEAVIALFAVLPPVVRPLGVVGLPGNGPSPTFEFARRNLPKLIGVAAVAILAAKDPVLTFASTNASAVETVFYITDRAPAEPAVSYSNSPDTRGPLTYGRALVLAPIPHATAGLDFPYPVRRGKSSHYEIAPDSISAMPENVFFDTVKAALRADSSQELIFVHGFATPFNDSLLRVGQLAHDLKFKGVPIAFSWPGGNIYPTDKENAIWAAKHLRQSLADLKNRTEAQHMHVIAHSMGSLVLGSALDGAALEKGAIDNVVFAAPDVNEALFAQYSDAIKSAARRVTVYASPWDDALLASKTIQAERVGSRVVTRPGIDVIDTEDADHPFTVMGFIGHSYVFDSQMMLNDLAWLINDDKPPDARPGAIAAGMQGCWKLEKRQSS